VVNIEADCSCTAGIIKNKILNKGDKTNINLKFNSKGKKGKQEVQVGIISNDKNNPIIQFKITGNVQ
ncbi:MAG: DUF1573 domain-containing protein, partial [Candidatus Firestonebacteria bacterium]